jgi:hypothetical protein
MAHSYKGATLGHHEKGRILHNYLYPCINREMGFKYPIIPRQTVSKERIALSGSPDCDAVWLMCPWRIKTPSKVQKV